MQTHPPRYRRATDADTFDDWVAEQEAWDEAHKPKRQNVKRRRVRPSATEQLFDVSRWRLPTRWRNDKRVGDAAIAKMTRGCDPRKLEALASGRFDEMAMAGLVPTDYLRRTRG